MKKTLILSKLEMELKDPGTKAWIQMGFFSLSMDSSYD